MAPSTHLIVYAKNLSFEALIQKPTKKYANENNHSHVEKGGAVQAEWLMFLCTIVSCLFKRIAKSVSHDLLNCK